MEELEQRIKDALDEARMVVLVVQVLLGFQFRAVLERRFDGLPHVVQVVHLDALGLLVATFTLAVSPATFHRLAEHGNDTSRVLAFTSRMIGLALLPFASAVGCSFFVVADVTNDHLAAVGAGLVGFMTAVGLWYVWPLTHRRAHERQEHEMTQHSPIATKIDHTLTEARMILPGAQALLGFQFVSFFAEGFATLPPLSRAIHFMSLSAVALASMLLIAPAAFHRMAEQGRSTPRFYRYASRTVQASLVPLAVGMSADFYVVATKITDSVAWGMMTSGGLLVGMLALWFGYPFVAQRRA